MINLQMGVYFNRDLQPMGRLVYFPGGRREVSLFQYTPKSNLGCTFGQSFLLYTTSLDALLQWKAHRHDLRSIYAHVHSISNILRSTTNATLVFPCIWGISGIHAFWILEVTAVPGRDFPSTSLKTQNRWHFGTLRLPVESCGFKTHSWFCGACKCNKT